MPHKFYHVAFRCRDAAETAKFYTEALGLKFSHALTNDIVPSVNLFSPHIHIFFELPDGSNMAFFEVPLSPPKEKDRNTPEWVDHTAFEVSSMQELEAHKARLVKYGVDVIGPVDHDFAHSIYFFDPNGLRLEVTYPHPEEGDAEKNLAEAYPILEAWEKRKAAGDWQPPASHAQQQ